MSAVVDTNVLIFDTFDDSELHAEAKGSLDSLEGWVLPSIVFHEYVWFMKAENLDLSFTKEKVIEYMTHTKTRSVPIQVDDIIFSIRTIDAYPNYNDFLILSVAKRLRHPLLTFDEKLKRHASRHGIEIFER